MAVVRRFSVAMAAAVGDVALKRCQASFGWTGKIINFVHTAQIIAARNKNTNLRASSSCILLSGAERVHSGGGIRDRVGLLDVPLLALLDKLMESFCLVIVVSEDVKLIPLSVYMLPHLLNLLIFESGIDLDARIEDCEPLGENC